MIRALIISLLLCFPVLAQALACDAAENENFLTFFFHFSGDKTFAVSRTVYPLKVIAQKYGIDEMGNDLSSATRLARSKQQDVELPSLSQTLQNGNLIAKVHEKSSTANVVQVFGENSEWGQTYHFALQGKCWYLREFREHTISDQHWVERQEFTTRPHQVAHFYIKPDNQQVRAMLRVLNHLSIVQESLTLGDTEEAKFELVSLCESVEASADYAIKGREQLANQLREALSLFNRGGDAEGSVLLGIISRTLWATVD